MDRKIDYNINCKNNKTCKLALWIIQEYKFAYYFRNYTKSLAKNNTYHKIPSQVM